MDLQSLQRLSRKTIARRIKSQKLSLSGQIKKTIFKWIGATMIAGSQQEQFMRVTSLILYMVVSALQ
jgi:hypothetical protein